MNNNIDGLRAAVKLSPDNIPLRLLLADALLSAGELNEAEIEFTNILKKNESDDNR